MNAIVSFRLCKLSTNEILDKLDEQCDDMYRKQKVPTRHIPARPDDDFDLLLGECIIRYRETLKKLEDLNSALHDKTLL